MNQYNGENRLISTTDGTTTVTMAYDYMGRRVMKTVADGESRTFVYDGWNLVQEIVDGADVTENVWGLDVSQSASGAAGIGGLLASVGGAQGAVVYLYDGNGNVGQVLAVDDGAIDQSNEFDPFGGRLAASTGGGAFGFSTIYGDSETAQLAYNFRKYQPGVGRWLNRDPIGVRGGANMYGFLANAPTYDVDILGLAGGATHGIRKCLPGDDCATLTKKMEALVRSIAERRGEMLPFSTVGQSYANWQGHIIQINQQYAMLMNCQAYYGEHSPPCCGGAPDINPYPLPHWKPEQRKEQIKRIGIGLGTVGTGVLTFLLLKKVVGAVLLVTPAAPVGAVLIVTP